MKNSEWMPILCVSCLLVGLFLGAYLENKPDAIKEQCKIFDNLGDRYDDDGPVNIKAYKDGKQVGSVKGFSSAIIRTPDVDSFIITTNP